MCPKCTSARWDQPRRESEPGPKPAPRPEIIQGSSAGEERFVALARQFYRMFRGKSIMRLIESTMQQELRAAMAAMESS